MSLHGYADMLFKSARIETFQEAIEAVVEPGMRVLEVGTGLGTYAFFAARAGAETVTALESEPVVHLARSLAERNRLDSRVEFLQARAPQGIPEGRYDLVVFEDYPTPFWDRASWELLEAIQERHLAPGGMLLPRAVRFGLAPVLGRGRPGDPDPREAVAGHAFGIDWTDFRDHLANVGRKVHLHPDVLGGEVVHGPTTALAPLPVGHEWALEGCWTGTGEAWVGLALWFDMELADGLWVSNLPQERGEPWGQWLLPLMPTAVVPPGVTATARVWRDLRDDGSPGWMGWSCTWEGGSRRGHEFAGTPLSLESLTGGGA